MYNVIGSGTAAWIACLYLIKANKPVTLHRSPDVVVRRIGESTVPTINEIPKLLGMSDEDFLEKVNGYFKYGTMFNGWKDNNNWLYYSANEPDSKTTARHQTYAYHIDSPLFCEVLQEWCEKQELFTLVNKTFSKSDYNKDDFYVDATGQSGVLKDIVGFEQQTSDFLINDCAITGNEDNIYQPFTNSQAMSNGWLWSISLQTRMSHGYVFSEKYQSVEDAIIEFEEHTGIKHENVVRFETRMPKDPWQGNVLFLGLSAGFIEPLNATANFAAQSGIKNFIALEHNPKAYNRLINHTYTGIHKWIKALYSCNTRQGEYWDYYKQNKENALKDIEFYSEKGHQGLMGKHSWTLLKKNML